MSNTEILAEFTIWQHHTGDPKIREDKLVTLVDTRDDEEPRCVEISVSHGKSTYYLKIDREDLMVALAKLK